MDFIDRQRAKTEAQRAAENMVAEKYGMQALSNDNSYQQQSGPQSSNYGRSNYGSQRPSGRDQGYNREQQYRYTTESGDY